MVRISESADGPDFSENWHKLCTTTTSCMAALLHASRPNTVVPISTSKQDLKSPTDLSETKQVTALDAAGNPPA